MNAKEARDKATEIYKSAETEEYKKVKEHILLHVNAGRFKCELRNPLSKQTQDKLEEEGYKYKNFYDQRDDSSICWIEW